MAAEDSIAVHKHALAALEASDMVLAHAPSISVEEPHTMDMITKEWLSHVLGQEKVPGAQIDVIEVVGGHEGMTSRHKWRLTWNETGKDAGLPTVIFFKATPEMAPLREMLSLLHMAELETLVYNNLHKDLEGLIPICHYARSYPGGRHMIILEDLEQRDIVPHWQADICTPTHARAVAVTLAKIHAKFWKSPRLDTDLVWVRSRSRRFGKNWLSALFSSCRAKFLAGHELAAKFPPEFHQMLRRWDEVCETIYEYWDTKPRTLLHGDSHLGNTLEFPDGTAGYYDWQCVIRGYGPRDLSYFLMGALPLEVAKEHERSIFDLYFDTLQQLGVEGLDRDEMWLDYCLFVMEPLDACVCTVTTGGYGHAAAAFDRHIETIGWCLKEHGVIDLLEKVVKTGSV